MRTPEQIAETDREAARIGYVAPPAHMEPTGLMGEDRAWERLGEWFETHTHSWSTALEVYISRRFDHSIPEVYHAIDSWMKYELRRRDLLEDLEAHHGYGN